MGAGDDESAPVLPAPAGAQSPLAPATRTFPRFPYSVAAPQTRPSQSPLSYSNPAHGRAVVSLLPPRQGDPGSAPCRRPHTPALPTSGPPTSGPRSCSPRYQRGLPSTLFEPKLLYPGLPVGPRYRCWSPPAALTCTTRAPVSRTALACQHLQPETHPATTTPPSFPSASP